MQCKNCGDQTWWVFRPATNEDGWECLECEWKPGEPPGFCPQLDQSLIEEKVHDFMLHLTGQLGGKELIYVSNSCEGDAIEGAVADRCKREEALDGYSIMQFILEQVAESHAKYWRGIRHGVLTGNDRRPRCHCGKLATVFGKANLCSEHFVVKAQ